MEKKVPKTVILGIYAGRSGSKSLATFLSQQPDMSVSWEQSGFGDIPSLNNSKRRFTNFRKDPETFVGDLDYRWIWHLGDYWHIPTVKIVYLYRDPSEIADSFWSYLKAMPFAGTALSELKDEETVPSSTHMLVSWPWWGFNASRDDIYRTVCQYQAEVHVMSLMWPQRMFMIRTEELSDLDRMMLFLDQIGYPKEGRVEELHKISSWQPKGIPHDMEEIEVMKTKPWTKESI